ncbi:MAG TPA: thiamine pyrophosphate-requiring protein [Candidatus Dormibacteraeota bacterium]|jgi:pyruvate dehydrogenase (quinone)|nr:thiamine pyrophosphate-requiring protein [Candidatus Dormibacteraeota bacterium]
MALTVGDYMVRRLEEWGVRTVYGYSGDGITPFFEGLRREEERVRFVQVRHEEQAAFMACAHAKFTGEVGVCTATSGPGAIHLLNGLYDAKLDHAPVVAIVGQAPLRSLGGHMQQEVDLPALFKDVASEYCQMVAEPSMARHVLDRAMRIAKARRTVTCVVLPPDVGAMEAVPAQPHASKTVHTGVGWREPRVVPYRADLEAAAEILNSGERVAMLVGAGALHATDEVIAVADVLGAGVAKALLGKAAVPDDVPFCTNTIGLLGTRPSWEMMQECDTLLMVGSSFPYSDFLPEEGQARGVQIDLMGEMLSLRYPMDLPLVGDSRETLRELLPLLRRKQDRSWQEKIVRSVEEWWRLMDERAQPRATERGLNPQALFASLSRQLPDDAIISSDSGSAANWSARHIRMRRGMRFTLSGNLATMLPGVPYAIAAKFAFPERLAVATMGDGAVQMGGMNELLTAAKYFREWADPRMCTLVLNNGDLNQVTWEFRVLYGDPKFEASQDIPRFDFAEFARDIGLIGIRVDRPDRIDEAWREALSADRPVVIDAVVDPEEPPLPPHITVEQVRKMAEAMLKGDPERVPTMLQSARQKIEEFLPGR